MTIVASMVIALALVILIRTIESRRVLNPRSGDPASAPSLSRHGFLPFVTASRNYPSEGPSSCRSEAFTQARPVWVGHGVVGTARTMPSCTCD